MALHLVYIRSGVVKNPDAFRGTSETPSQIVASLAGAKTVNVYHVQAGRCASRTVREREPRGSMLINVAGEVSSGASHEMDIKLGTQGAQPRG